jgi:hypothetical protein
MFNGGVSGSSRETSYGLSVSLLEFGSIFQPLEYRSDKSLVPARLNGRTVCALRDTRYPPFTPLSHVAGAAAALSTSLLRAFL